MSNSVILVTFLPKCVTKSNLKEHSNKPFRLWLKQLQVQATMAEHDPEGTVTQKRKQKKGKARYFFECMQCCYEMTLLGKSVSFESGITASVMTFWSWWVYIVPGMVLQFGGWLSPMAHVLQAWPPEWCYWEGLWTFLGLWGQAIGSVDCGTLAPVSSSLLLPGNEVNSAMFFHCDAQSDEGNESWIGTSKTVSQGNPILS
jgi:hypothetical protein